MAGSSRREMEIDWKRIWPGSDGGVRPLHWSGLVILALYVALAGVYNVVAPPFESPDEVGHFFTVKYIADYGRLPVPEKEVSKEYLYGQEGTQPPLYYLGGACLLRLSAVNTEDAWDYLRVNPHTTCGSPRLTGNKAFLAHDPAREAFPWSDAILALHLLRLYSTALGLLTIVGVYATARLCFPGHPAVAPLATALTALNPQFIFVSAGVNNDNLVVALSVWSLYLMLRTVRLSCSLTRPNDSVQRVPRPLISILIGFLVGLAALTKMAGLLLLPLAGLTVLLAVWLRDQDGRLEREGSARPVLGRWSLIVGHGLLIGAPTLAVAGWWYVRNALLYADPTLIEHHLDIVSRRDPTPLLLILREIPSIFYSYWGRFSCDLSPGGWYYAFWGLLTLVGVGSVVARWRRLARFQRIALFLLSLWFVVVFLGWFRWNLIASGVQGRLLFPATVSVSLLVGAGLATWVRHRLWAGAGLIFTWVALAIWALFGLIRPAYAPPPRYSGVGLIGARAPEIPHRLDGVFGERIALLGYELRPAELEAGQGLDVTLYLSALRPMTDTYSMGLWLVSAIPGDTARLAGLDTWPGGGNYPTHVWQPGEIVVDSYRLPIPEEVSQTQAWMVQVNFYHMEDGEWFPFAQDGRVVGEKAILEWVRVGASEPPKVPPEARLESPVVFGEAVALPGARIALEEPGLRVSLWWEALRPLDIDYTVFVHLTDGEGRLIGTGDGPPLGGGFPTRLWRSGDGLVDEHVISLPPELPADVYTIRVGWYDPATGVRLPAVQEGRRLPQDAAVIGTWSPP